MMSGKALPYRSSWGEAPEGIWSANFLNFPNSF